MRNIILPLTLLVMMAVGSLSDALAQHKVKAPASMPVHDSPFVCMYPVGQMPAFPGDLMSFLAKNLRYPDAALENGIDGKVIAGFVVRKDGSITDLRVVRSAGKDLDDEVLRVIRLMPAWIPGKNNRVPKDVNYVLPVHMCPI